MGVGGGEWGGGGGGRGRSSSSAAHTFVCSIAPSSAGSRAHTTHALTLAHTRITHTVTVTTCAQHAHTQTTLHTRTRIHTQHPDNTHNTHNVTHTTHNTHTDTHNTTQHMQHTQHNPTQPSTHKLTQPHTRTHTPPTRKSVYHVKAASISCRQRLSFLRALDVLEVIHSIGSLG